MVEYDFTNCYTKKEGKRQKFWQVKILGPQITIFDGVLGESNRTTERSFETSEEAFRWLADEVAKRFNTGFIKSGILDLPTATAKGSRSFSLPVKKSGLRIEDALHALRELEGHMKRIKNPDYRSLIAFPPPSVREIQSAEQRIGRKLPPSYTELVATFGTFEIRSEYGHFYWRLFPVSKLALVSTDLAKPLIGFQWAPHEGDDLYVFDAARADREGEMPVDLMTHEEMFQPSMDFCTFTRHIYELCQEIGNRVV